MNAILSSLGAFAATFAGGLLALRFRERLHFILSFSAGVLLGVVSFELLPEIFKLSGAQAVPPTGALIALVAGFLVFHSVEKLALVHHAQETAYATHHHPRIGVLSALALAGHSFMDGIGIGLAFQASPAVGIAVTMAVIAHDFCDGLNTVGLMLVHQNTERRSFVLLTVDALAPILGAISTLLFRVPPSVLMLFLGFFAGFLLYISASDILPEAHSQARPATTLGLIAMTCVGAVFIFIVARALA